METKIGTEIRKSLEEKGILKSLETQTKERIEAHQNWEKSPQFQFPIGTRIKLRVSGYTGTVVDRMGNGHVVVHMDMNPAESRVVFSPSMLDVVEKAQYPKKGI